MKQYTQLFEHKKRDNGDYFTCLKDNIENEQLMTDLIYGIHRDCFGHSLPSDWIYAQIFNAFEALEDGRDFDDCRSELEPDCYTHDLIEWSRNGWAQLYIDEAMSELGAKDFNSAISWGQVLAIEAVYQRVYDFIEENQEDEV